MGRREMGIEDESGKCGKMPEREGQREEGAKEERKTAGERESLERN